jgi:hypothetical protein
MKYARELPLHPILFGAYPVIALLAHNVEQARPNEALRALIVSLVGATVCLLILKLLLRDWRKAALASTLFVVLFFSYGHFYDFVRQIPSMGSTIGRHRYLVPLWVGIFGLGLWWIWKRLRDLSTLTMALNVAAVVALILPIAQIIDFEIRLSSVRSQAETDLQAACETSLKSIQSPPDIYYIILDAYTRGDVLEHIYSFDNSSFLNDLEGMGFYIAQGSQSNYCVTGLSLASSLNMEYLDKLDERFSSASTAEWIPLWPLLTKSVTRRNLECLGYSVMTFDSGYYWSGWRDADIFFDPASTAITKLERAGGVNAFESMLIESSAGLVLTDIATLMPEYVQTAIESPYREHRAKILYLLDTLEEVVPKLEGPKFVFAHVLLPHPPFVIGPEGEPIEQTGAFTLGDAGSEMPFDERAVLYIGQVKYVNQRIIRIVREILERSEKPPIIVIQGDHGLDGPLSSQMAILNAYHLPEDGDQLLYETISPVNTFRVIFDAYFDGNYELIEDISYYSRHDDPFNLTLVPNEISTQK